MTLSPVTRRRLQNFRAHRLGFWSFVIFMVIFCVTLFAELIANDRPLVVKYDGHWYFPALVGYAESDFLPDGLPLEADYRDSTFAQEISGKGWMLWPVVPYSYDTVIHGDAMTALQPPSFAHWLGTDDQARDVMARVIHGFRISVLFGFMLTILASIIGVIAGAVQGFYGGWIDLLFQRVIEVWGGLPSLLMLVILASIITPNFWILLGFMLLFSWHGLTGVVRAEFLRGRSLDYVRAAKALGVSDARVMLRHILPNAMVALLTFLPFSLSGSVTVLSSLDFLGFGLPPGSPSLGELVQQAKNNMNAPWLMASSFFVLGGVLLLLVFTGEAVRDAFDPRKQSGGER